jgi:predicted metalloendopeptidase
MLDKLKALPTTVWFYLVGGLIVLTVVLKFTSKVISTNAKELNLKALIEDALNSLKLQQNKDKIKELKKPVNKDELETDPNKVEDFYKNRK